MYTTKIALNEEISAWQSTGKPSDALVKTINKMIEGIIGRYGSDILDKDGCSQVCWILLLRHYQRLKITGNSFSYITTMILNSVRHAKRGQRTEYANLAKYYESESFKNKNNSKM